MKESLIKIFLLPPPNITGKLHLGHALNYILTDIIIRKNRMMGLKTICIPGFDHAGIATQIIIEKHFQEYGILSKFKKYKKDILKKFVIKWKNNCIKKIKTQIKKFKTLVNWNLEYFTMDKIVSKIVKKVFICLYKKNFIYKKKKLINWDPIINTTVSNLETKLNFKKLFIIKLIFPIYNCKGYLLANKNINSIFNTIVLLIKNFKNIKFYKKKLFLISTNKKLSIITKFFKKKNNLNFIKPKYSRYNYKKLKNLKLPIKVKFKKLILINIKIKKNILLCLKKKKLINKFLKKNIIITISKKTNSKIKFKIKKQWFLSINNKKNKLFKKKHLQLIKKKNLKIIPEKWKNYFKKFFKNTEDWCISRQLWWGHPIPIYYKRKKNIIINNFKNKIIIKKNIKLKKEKYVLDTWFSSCLIPLILNKILKINFKNQLFRKIEILISGYDIILFWIIKMILISLYFKKKNPFKTIYIHGLIVDKNNKKMSKSLGNIIDPINLINGLRFKNLVINKKKLKIKNINCNNNKIAFPKGFKKNKIDNFRLTITSISNTNKNINLNIDDLLRYERFNKKLVNITIFIINNCKIYKNFNIIKKKNNNNENNHIFNKWIRSSWEETKLNIIKSMNNLKHNYANKYLYNYIINLYSKYKINIFYLILKESSIKKKYNICKIMLTVFYEIIKVIHPIIPVITQKIFKKLKNLIESFEIDLVRFKFIILCIYPKIEINLIEKKLKNLISNKFIKLIKNKNTFLKLYLFKKNYKFLSILKYLKNILGWKIFHIITNKNVINLIPNFSKT